MRITQDNLNQLAAAITRTLANGQTYTAGQHFGLNWTLVRGTGHKVLSAPTKGKLYDDMHTFLEGVREAGLPEEPTQAHLAEYFPELPKLTLSQQFLRLMAEYGATMNKKGFHTFTLSVGGHRLGVSPYLKDKSPWIACKWECGDPEARKAWIDAPEEGGQADALYAVYKASLEREHAEIVAKGLPHNNPHSLKWNHHGADCVASLRAGLESIKNKGE